MDEPIRSHLPNENYRRGWDAINWADKSQEPVAKPCKCGYWSCTPCAWMSGFPIEHLESLG